MSTATLYPLTRTALLKGSINLETATVKLQAVSSSYTYSASHDFFDDVGAGARLGTAATLGTKTFTNGEFNAAAVSYSGVTAGAIIIAFIGYVDTGTESTSPLIWYCGVSSDASSMSFTAPGGTFTVKWPYGKIFTI